MIKTFFFKVHLWAPSKYQRIAIGGITKILSWMLHKEDRPLLGDLSALLAPSVHLSDHLGLVEPVVCPHSLEVLKELEGVRSLVPWVSVLGILYAFIGNFVVTVKWSSTGKASSTNQKEGHLKGLVGHIYKACFTLKSLFIMRILMFFLVLA